MVGELHSLTDWHVSEASDDAELDDFFSRKTEKKMLTNAQTDQKSISACELKQPHFLTSTRYKIQWGETILLKFQSKSF